jgi:hypothetical protein
VVGKNECSENEGKIPPTEKATSSRGYINLASRQAAGGQTTHPRGLKAANADGVMRKKRR